MRALSMGVPRKPTSSASAWLGGRFPCLVGLVMIGAATYYNVFLNPRLAGVFV